MTIEGEEKPAMVADALALLVGSPREAKDETHDPVPR